MSKYVYVDFDFNGNKISNFRIDSFTTAEKPAAAVDQVGRFIYNSTTYQIEYCTQLTSTPTYGWNVIATASSVSTLSTQITTLIGNGSGATITGDSVMDFMAEYFATFTNGNAITGFTYSGNTLTVSRKDYTVAITSSTSDSSYAKVYTFTQEGSTIGTIQIPKDLVVTSGKLVTVTVGSPSGTQFTDSDSYTGLLTDFGEITVTGKYLKILFSVSGESPVYIDVRGLVDVYSSATNSVEGIVTLMDTADVTKTAAAGGYAATPKAIYDLSQSITTAVSGYVKNVTSSALTSATAVALSTLTSSSDSVIISIEYYETYTDNSVTYERPIIIQSVISSDRKSFTPTWNGTHTIKAYIIYK